MEFAKSDNKEDDFKEESEFEADSTRSTRSSLNNFSILCGIASYFLLFIKSTFWTVLFGIFAFFVDMN